MLPLTPAQQRADIVLAAGVCVGALVSATLSAVAGVYGAEQSDFALAVVYAFVLAVPIAFRRRLPATAAVVVAVAYFAAVTLRVPELYAGNIAMFIAFYTVGAWSPNRVRARWTRLGITAGMFAWLLITLFVEAAAPAPEGGLSRAGAFSPYAASILLMILINVLYFAGAYSFGERTWAAARQRTLLEERTAELERERERTAVQAVALERVRIARELHDVVAHHVSLMGVQAGVARTVLASDPAAATATLTQIEEEARTALGELRHLLQTLRTNDEDEASDPAALDTRHGLAQLDALPALATDATDAGLPTSVTVVGEPCALPETVQLNLYRIAQEALTNARRHGGPGAAADVRLRYTADAVELEVSNTGRRASRTDGGMGHLGMRERAAASGGSIELIPRPQGGFVVRARVPLERAHA
ncbi:sensor histidine kinase [Microbacterium sp. SORGH_AS_0888]|uniref:sensor histidine kinase n=1 Tax=Microbacterium sp. SORGH_AS_0888 TaxID=3041791 RepID=UPI00278ACCEC|nr:sensor histidine kinase [Microbacterium sp. SORGH_AS_0888]MDQ1129775.1 signal transduction histidine kinase [Microbacterium sp. SORGH_AS_0888]